MKVFRASYTMELQDLFFLIRPVVITGKYTHTHTQIEHTVCTHKGRRLYIVLLWFICIGMQTQQVIDYIIT